MTTQDLFTRFQQRLAALGGTEGHQASNLPAAASIIADHPALADRKLVIPPDFSDSRPWSRILPLLREKGINIREADSPAGIADAPAGLSSAELAVAETGSVLMAENSLVARAVSMLTMTHFVLIRACDLVPMLDDVGKRLQQLTQAGPDQRHYISLITGPSRTSDIERSLTIGVQGPKVMCILVVTDWETEL
ncbi:hypothetical protein EPA93_46965 [Ktedonosporobacter rubrisoli]|uniref:LUD domain-containing protein n=1 Tax=Ktedonosporobacter rubrisoli TaxID=2509675 RepID=A0A4P6K481_KTERU|nr:lactate utilization protein [Ktedonosporobacter rubrisoli]QBD83108.1 hypothetical protein EPA93_46965 [Ktedonosporobacter rubrisoli]